MASKPLQSKLKTSSITVVISLALVIFLLGIVGWIFINAKLLVNHVKENVTVQVYLKEDASKPDADRLKKIIDAGAYTKTAVFKSKEEAAEEMKEKTGDDFVAFLGFKQL